MMEMQHINGTNKGRIVLYTLSTCIWCKKTKKLLDSLGVEYYYVDMDMVDADVKDDMQKKLETWNPQCSYPTMVYNDEKCIIGYEEKEIRSMLE